MKIILLIGVSLILIGLGGVARASEIFGQISTNPNNPSGQTSAGPSASPTPVPPAINSGGSSSSSVQTSQPVSGTTIDLPIVIQPVATPINASGADVLGEKIYPDGTLLRANNHKIYVIQWRIKKHLLNFKELEKYCGQVILEVTAEELSSFEERGHLDGELIRQIGDAKVYVITRGGKQHILNLAELREHYFGLEIFNISRREIELY